VVKVRLVYFKKNIGYTFIELTRRATQHLKTELDTHIRSEVCNGLLKGLAILVAPIFFFSVYRFQINGWQSIGYLYVISSSTILLTFFFRAQLGLHIRASVCVGVISIIGIAGIFSFGVTASSGAYIPFASVFAALIYGQRNGILLLLLLTLLTASIEALYLSGYIETLPEAVYGKWLSPTEWVLRLGSWFMLALATILAIGLITRDSAVMVQSLSEKSQALESSQQSLQGLLDNIVDMVYRTDLEGRFVEISAAVEDLLGFRPEELLGQQITDRYVDPEARKDLMQLLEENDGKINHFDTLVYNKAGETQTLSINLKYWRSVEGEVLGVEGVARNVTEQKVTEQALLRAQKVEAVGQLTAGIAHDFNNVLAIVMGNAEMLLSSDSLKEVDRDAVTEILKSADQGAGITKRLLAYSRPDTMSPEVTDLNKSIVGLAGMFRSALGANIDLTFDLKHEGTVALIDENQLETTLLNLIINARDAMPEGGEISISSDINLSGADIDEALIKVDETKFVGIWVNDTGSGMKPEVVKKIREPFYTSKPIGIGNGLGLSMVDRFVHESSGHLIIESEFGKGTSVGLFFPQVYAEVPASSTKEEAPNRDTVGAIKVLIIEDSPGLLSLVRRMLRSRGYQVLGAEDGPSALQVASEEPELALIISDVMLPGSMSGWDIFRTLSESRENLKFIMMTGYSAEEQDGLEVPILYKPFKQEELLAQVDNLLS